MAETPKRVGTSQPPVDGRTVRFAHRRQELLQGAVAYALEFGVTDLSMRKLATSLGISHTALAHHFGSKEALIFEIFEQLRKASVAAQAAGQRGDPQGLLEEYALWWTKWSAPPYIPALRLVFEVLGLAMRDPHQYAAFVAAPAQNWLDFLIPALRANHCPEHEVEAMATALMVFATGLQVDLLLSGERERIDAAHALFISMVEERRQRWLRDAGVTE
ncbi:MAG: TetR/AcrR family transcriptional regulator [Solirubrobacteraceae bacterium]|nr:TetR/AcrR family transcriptional regulator [Solirubrobacteraceae bacterium]